MSRERRGPALRWVVGPQNPTSLGALLERVDRAAALADGSVFVAGRRAERAELTLRPGDVVEIGAGRPVAAAATILVRDDGLLAVLKPPELPTEPDRRGGASLCSTVASALGVDRVHALSRLDVGVSGVALLAVSAEARERVQRLRERGGVRRRYLAIAASAPTPLDGTWGARLKGPRGAQAAETRYHTVARRPRGRRCSPSSR